MRNLENKLKEEIKEIQTYFNYKNEFSEIEPVDERENRVFDAGYIYGLKFALRKLKY